MARFVTDRDYQFFQHINKEIMFSVVDVSVTIYKIIPDLAKVNIYGETNGKPRYRGISAQALVRYPKNDSQSEGFGYDVNQQAEFRFQRKLLQDVEVYPEVGDIVAYNSNFYEINTINEVQLIAGKPQYNNSILCMAHLTRKSALDIEETHT